MELIKSVSRDGLELYLSRKGWKKERSNRDGIEIFIEPNQVNPFEIFLPKRITDNSSQLLIEDAIKTLSHAEGLKRDEVVLGIIGIDKDLFNYRLPVESSEAVSVVLMREVLDATTHAFKEASYYEAKLYYDELSKVGKKNEISPKDQSFGFMKECRFAHTWKGSFGVTIEVPLQLPSYGLFDDIPDTLGRKTSKRIMKGFSIVEKAVELGSVDYILDNILVRDDILSLEAMPSLLGVLRNCEINLGVKYSPLISIEHGFVSDVLINEKKLLVLEAAIDKVKYPDEIKDIVVIGFPETISSSKEDLLEDIDDAARRVTVRGISSQVDGKVLALKMDLSLDDYKKAIRAQAEVREVRVRCDVKKRYRGWEVVNVKSFDLIL